MRSTGAIAICWTLLALAPQAALAGQAGMGDLMGAIRAGDEAAVSRIIAASPELLDQRDGRGTTPLSFAAYAGRTALVETIRARRPAPDFWEACIVGDVASVKAALARGQAVNATAPDGYTPLGLAVFFRNPEIVALLLGAGADPNLQAANAQRVGPLHAAVARGDIPTLVLLLEKGADPDRPQEKGLRPLHEAAGAGNVAAVAVLLLFGADPGALTEGGKTPADLARDKDHAALADRLAARAGVSG